MKSIKEQESLIAFLQAAIEEGRAESPLNLQRIARLEVELRNAQADLSKLSPQASPSIGERSLVEVQRSIISREPRLNLIIQTESWYQTFFSNIVSLFVYEEKQYQITAQPIDTNLMVEVEPWQMGFWDNLKSLFSVGKKDYQITAQPIQTKLLMEEVPWYRAILSGLKYLFVKEDVSEIQVTAEPVEVGDIFNDYKIRSSSFILSVILQVSFVAVVLLMPLLLIRDAKVTANETALYFVDKTPLILNLPRAAPSGGGGGGGLKAPKPPSKGKLPKPSKTQFTPPTTRVVKRMPLLPVEPTVIVPQLAQLPIINLPDYGDPLGIPGPPSPGPGSGGGVGTGSGSGVGSGEGSGVGPGKGGGIGGGVYRVGGGVTPPTVMSRFEPVYSEEARKAKYQGVVVLSAIVRKDGTIEILKVIRSLGLGLDENAINALKKWKFRPGMKGGKPVDVALNIEVNFSLR